MNRALAIGVLTAIVLTIIRGGSVESPWIPIVFGLAGFFGTLVVSAMVRFDPIQTSDSTIAPQKKHVAWLRNLFALAIALSLFWWSGPFIISAMYAGWLVAILLSIVAPLVICLFASHWPIAFGLLSATGIITSVVLENSRWASNHGNPNFWEDFWSGECWIVIAMWAISASLSLAVSIPIHLNRRRRLRSSGHQSDTAA